MEPGPWAPLGPLVAFGTNPGLNSDDEKRKQNNGEEVIGSSPFRLNEIRAAGKRNLDVFNLVRLLSGSPTECSVCKG